MSNVIGDIVSQNIAKSKAAINFNGGSIGITGDSFCIGKEIKQILAKVEGTEYTLSNVSVNYELGGTATGIMTVTGKPSPLNVKTIDIDSQDPFTDRQLDNLKEVKITLISSSGNELLFTGYILGRVNDVGIGASSFAVSATYKIANSLALLDRPPLGAFYRLSCYENVDPNGAARFQINKNNLQALLQFSEAAEFFRNASKNKSLNLAKFIASILDSTFGRNADGSVPTSVGSTAPIKTISSCINNLGNAPGLVVSSDVNKANLFITHIVRSITSMYGVSPALAIFKKMLATFYLILAPRTNGKCDVIVDNAFTKNIKLKMLPKHMQQYHCEYYNNYREDIGCVIADASECLTDRVSESPANNCIAEASAFCFEQMGSGGPTRVEGKCSGKKKINGLELKAVAGNTNTRFYRVDTPRVLVDLFVKAAQRCDIGELALFVARNAYATINRANSILYVTLITSLFSLNDVVKQIGKVHSISYSPFGKTYVGRLGKVQYVIDTSGNGFKQKLMLFYTNVRTDKEQANLYVMNPFYKDSDQ